MSKVFNIDTILGHSVTDTVTGLKGVCTGVAEFHYGPPRIAVTPVKLNAGEPADMLWFDVPRLKVGKAHTVVERPNPVVALGSKVKDQITGYTGIATGRYTYLNGCIRIEVTSKELKNGQPKEAAVFDEQRITGSPNGPGGPRSGPTPYATCKR